MSADNDLPKRPVSYYGKKLYYINHPRILIAQKALPQKKEPKYTDEDIEEHREK